jgi:hypothetical protein
MTQIETLFSDAPPPPTKSAMVLLFSAGYLKVGGI